MMVLHMCEFKDCNATFSKPSLLKSHSFIHTGQRPHMCLVENCFKSYTRAAHLKRHEEISHGIKNQKINFKCDQCSRLFKLASHLKNHYKRCKANGFCSEDDRKLKSTNQQLSTKPTDNAQEIFICGTIGLDDQEKKTEDVQTKVIEKSLFLCTQPGCDSSFTTNDNLKRHLKTYHERRKFTCNYCMKQFLKHQHLKIHEYEHTQIKPFKCDECDRVFLLPSRLKAHMKMHKGYTCSFGECDAKFGTWTALRSHMKDVHPTEYFCGICSKKFTSKHNLKIHLSVHEKEREAFHCPYDNCVRYYFFKKNLTQHIKFVHESYRYKCEHEGCTKSYRKKATLINHQEVHSPNYVPPQKVKKPKMKKKPEPNELAKKLSGIPKKFTIEELNWLATVHEESTTDEETAPVNPIENYSCITSKQSSSQVIFKSSDEVVEEIPTETESVSGVDQVLCQPDF